MHKCKWCNKEFNLSNKPKGWMANHSRWCDKNPKRNDYINTIKNVSKKINIKNRNKSIAKAWKDGKYNNVNFNRNKKPLTEEHKKKISNSIKNLHDKGLHPGWSHINTDPNRMSRPERIFKSLLKENPDIFGQYNIEYGYPYSKYFLDFAILEIKLDIEIDGQQHFRNKETINHDKKRDEFLLNNDWQVYRISVKELYENKNNVLDKLILFIEEKSKYRKYDIEEIKQQYTYIPKYGSKDDYLKAKKNKNDLKAKPIIENLMNSNIDFGKFGWVGKAAKIINIKPQKVNQWMKRHMPEFYNNKCFKRK